MSARTYELSFSGGFLRRGFWLYIWEITGPTGTNVYYVGRTGDNSSLNAQSPFNRMGQHLGFRKNNNMLRKHLETRSLETDLCTFHLVAHGPILHEVKDVKEHRTRRDHIGALEQALSEEMGKAGYDVMNRVKGRFDVDRKVFAEIKEAFAQHFVKLADT